MSDTQNYIQQNKERFLEELKDLLRIASISADPAYKNEVLNCADAVAKHLKNAGADHVEICETKGYPVVFGEKIVDKNLPTVLVYGHYDVQPAALPAPESALSVPYFRRQPCQRRRQLMSTWAFQG